MLVLRGFHIVRQNLVPLDLADDGQTVDTPLPRLTKLLYFFHVITSRLLLPDRTGISHGIKEPRAIHAALVIKI